MGFRFFNIMYTVVPIIVVAGIAFTIAMIISPRLRAHFMGKQVKAVNYMVNDNKEELKNITDAGVDITRSAVTQTARALKDGLTDSNSGSMSSAYMFCAHCGAQIETDSSFCKACGKRVKN